jgi:pimeloyl-ACP methyl ester carboxylesterase
MTTLNRRQFNKGGLGLLFGALASQASQVSAQELRQPAHGKNFVLVHGAWVGGWCWTHVAKRLRELGHTVTTPTCPGVGELRHLLTGDINLSTYIETIANHITLEGLKNVVLVGSGFSGVVISGVADRIPQSLSHLVYLDAMVLESGSSVFESQPAAVTNKRLEQVKREGKGIAIPPPPLASFGLKNEQIQQWVADRIAPQPVGTYTEKLVLRNPIGNGVPKTYIDCNAAEFPPLADVKKALKEQPGWNVKTLNAHHDPHLTEPTLLSNFLNTI